MDVLELPRPVINFLRNMAKEGTRYSLSWDIFGGADSVTLTLTWKLVDERLTMKDEIPPPLASNTFLNEGALLQLADHSSSQTRRSRRDECQTLARPVRRRAKSNLNQGQTASLERTSPLSSDPPLVRANATQRPAPSPTRATSSPPSPPPPPLQSLSLSLDRSQQHRPARRSSILNRTNRSPPTQFRRVNDEREENPWVKRLESAAKKRTDATESTQGKVKFKSQPDYF